MRLPLSVTKRLNGLFVTAMKSEEFQIKNQRNYKKYRPINNYIIIAVLMILINITSLYKKLKRHNNNHKEGSCVPH